MKRKQVAFTLLELLVVIGVLSLLATIIMPSLMAAKELAKSAVCMANQRSVSYSLLLYTEEYDEQLPYNVDRTPNVGGGQVGEIYDPYAPDVSWSVRVGAIESDQMPDYFFPDSPHERIAMDGYIEFNWYNRVEGPFKCPAAYDQVNPKTPAYWYNDTKGAGWGSCFSMNENLSPWSDESLDGTNDGDVHCTRISDISGQCVLIGDGTLRPRGRFIGMRDTYPVDSVTGALRTPRIPAFRDSPEKLFGPWTHQEAINPRLRTQARYDFYGHPGESANLTYSDGHVENVTTIDIDDWILE